MGIKCEICHLNDAQVKDYRQTGLVYSKYWVCPNCFVLNDDWFFKLKYASDREKRKIISEIVEGDWKDYIIG